MAMTETPERRQLLATLYDAHSGDYADFRRHNTENKLIQRQNELSRMIRQTPDQQKKTKRYKRLVLERRMLVMKRVLQYGADPPLGLVLDRALLQLTDQMPGVRESALEKELHKRDATLVLLKYMYMGKSDDELRQLSVD